MKLEFERQLEETKAKQQLVEKTLETLSKLKNVTGNARSVLDKLKGVKTDLVKRQIYWQD